MIVLLNIFYWVLNFAQDVVVSLEKGEAAITFDSNILNQHNLPELIVNCNPNKFKVI